jgi:hypothetical protein
MKMWSVRPGLQCRRLLVSGFTGGCGCGEWVGGLVEVGSVMS